MAKIESALIRIMAVQLNSLQFWEHLRMWIGGKYLTEANRNVDHI
jgi:hypothetical protein